jgi:alkanesulfonate monooxygenase SsuD/methylene tetrahydromethanopterin reductase-like flavin-dependent oxidoreductase (luciferase family)
MTESSSASPHALHLALEVDGDGAHPASWRHAGRPPEAVFTAHAVREAVLAAQSAGFALATFADGPLAAEATPDAVGRLEAGTRAAYVSTVTDRIGLAPTLHAPVTEPFHLATQLASLDHASHGRGAWIVGAANDVAARAAIGAEPLSPQALRVEIRDVVNTARALWDSWEDDAVIRDVATSRYLDSAKVHHIDFEGAGFSVKGPLITPRPPQGQLVVLAPDVLEVDALADVVLVGRPDLAGIGERARQAREAGAPLVFAELEVVLDAATPAVERLAELDSATPWPASADALRYVGSVAGLLELLRDLAEVVDGVRLHPAVYAVDLPVLIEGVLPVLAADGLLHEAPRPGATLRATLGLPRPANRFRVALAASQSR